MSSTQEFVVRVPRENGKKRFNVMRFGSALNVDTTKWRQTVMERENNLKEFKTETDVEFREFGAGSEFGKKQKEEAKRLKYSSNKKYNAEHQPWILKVGGKQAKKYKGIREGGVSENASYYVFFQAPDGAFEAFPVNEWYNFTPIQRYKALTAEEAEEKFERRDKILNYFSVMINKKRKDEESGENSMESKGKMKKGFKVSDMDDWQGLDSDNDNDNEDRSDEDVKPKLKSKGKKGVKKSKVSKKKKKKGSDDDEDDSEPLEESDEGDFDDKEVDYMSDSSESSEESENEKTNRALKGVEDEDALRQLVLSEDEEEEEEKEEKPEVEGEKSQNGDKTKEPEIDKKGKLKSDKLTANFDSPPPSSSDSDSDNSDLDESKSALLIQKKFKLKNESDKSSTNSRAATPTTNLEPSTSLNCSSSDSNKLKRKALLNDSPNLKKPKLSNDNSDAITEEAVRRYLMRKPMTCTDLLQKFKNKVSFKGDLVHTIAQILKRLNPEKQTIKNKLYFSLKPT